MSTYEFETDQLVRTLISPSEYRDGVIWAWTNFDGVMWYLIAYTISDNKRVLVARTREQFEVLK